MYVAKSYYTEWLQCETHEEATYYILNENIFVYSFFPQNQTCK